MALQAEDIADLVNATLPNLGRLRWTDLGTDRLDFIAFRKLMNKYRVMFQAGESIRWNVVVRNSGQAREVELYEQDSVDSQDVTEYATAPWRHIVGMYQFEAHERAFNGGGETQIMDLIKLRRNDAFTAMPELVERRFWTKPSSSSNKKQIYGIPYWVVWTDNGVTNPTGGFDGGNPSGFSAGAGGLDSTSFPRWKNWCAKWAAVSKEDLIRKWRKASRRTAFKPPVRAPGYGGASRYGYYTSDGVIELLEEVLEAQNDNLGNDLAPKDGEVVFKRIPVEMTDQFDGLTGNPIYGIDWSSMNPVCLKGWYLREQAKPSPTQHNVVQTFIDLTMNLRCTNRRSNFVLAQSSDI